MTIFNILIRASICLFICSTLAYATPVKLILDTDMSGDADDLGTLAMLNALYDINECEIVAVAVNRKDKTNASAAAVDAVNTWYSRPAIPIGTDKKPECNIRTNPEAATFVAAGCPVDIYWQDFNVGNKVITGAGLKKSPKENPVRRGYELRYFRKRPSIEGGQPSYDQCAALLLYAGRMTNFGP